MMQHIKALKKQITGFVLALIVSVLILALSSAYVDSVEQDKLAASNQLNQARTKYNLAKDRKRLMEEFEKPYRQLVEKGIVGDEDRLNWIDVIDNVTQKQGIPYVKYRIDRQQAVNDAGLARKYPDITLYKSTMTLEMQLLHEGDLYILINTLSDKASGLFDVSKCQIRRIKQNQLNILEQAAEKNFDASCTLNWYTMVAGGKG